MNTIKFSDPLIDYQYFTNRSVDNRSSLQPYFAQHRNII